MAQPDQTRRRLRRLWLDQPLFGHVALIAAAWVSLRLLAPGPCAAAPPAEQAARLAVAWAVVGVSALATLLTAVAWFRAKIGSFRTVMAMLAHSLLTILTFAGVYGALSISGAGCDDAAWWRTLYFSTVTFTTLGYGDCAPVGPTRAFAAFQALFSYYFVGFTIGALANLERPGASDGGAQDEAGDDDQDRAGVRRQQQPSQPVAADRGDVLAQETGHDDPHSRSPSQGSA